MKRTVIKSFQEKRFALIEKPVSASTPDGQFPEAFTSERINIMIAATSTSVKSIRSHDDAYALAKAIDNTLAEGESKSFNLITVTKRDIWLYVTGQIYNDGKETKFVPCELADFVLYPERKRVNDALKAEWNAAYFNHLRNWPNV